MPDNHFKTNKLLVTVEEAADLLSASPNFIRSEIQSGSLPVVKLTGKAKGKLRIHTNDLIAYSEKVRYNQHFENNTIENNSISKFANYYSNNKSLLSKN